MVHKVLPLGAGYGEQQEGRLCCGVETQTHRHDDNTVYVFYHQEKFAKHLVNKYEQKHGAIHAVTTPWTRAHGLSKKEATEPGVMADDARSMVQEVAYLIHTRVDVMPVVRFMQRHVAPGAWTKECDAALLRTYRYIKGSTNYGMNCVYVKDDVLTLELWSDADMAGDKDTRKSTAGGIMLLTGERGTRAMLGALCKLEPAISTSSAESETMAHVMGMKKLTLPMLVVIGDMITYIKSKIDAEACIKAIRNGYSRELEHMSLTQGVCVGWAHQLQRTLNDTYNSTLDKV
jgi:hypothetical protein